MAKITLENGITIEGTAVELAEMVAQMTSKADVVEDVAQPLKIGDYAKVVARTNTEFYEIHDFEINEIVRVEGGGYHEDAIKCRQVGGSNYDFLKPSDLVRATEEEITQAEADEIERKKTAVFTDAGRKPNEYRKGDIAKIVSNNSGSSNSVGDIGKITEVHHDGDVRVYVSGKNHMINWSKPREIEPIVFVENRLDRN